MFIQWAVHSNWPASNLLQAQNNSCRLLWLLPWRHSEPCQLLHWCCGSPMFQSVIDRFFHRRLGSFGNIPCSPCWYGAVHSHRCQLCATHTRNVIRHPLCLLEINDFLRWKRRGWSIENAPHLLKSNCPAPRLTPLSVELLTVFAEPIAPVTRLALPTGNIPARRTSAVIVMDTILSWFLDFIH
jgi:hypothetical protein